MVKRGIAHKKSFVVIKNIQAEKNFKYIFRFISIASSVRAHSFRRIRFYCCPASVSRPRHTVHSYHFLCCVGRLYFSFFSILYFLCLSSIAAVSSSSSLTNERVLWPGQRRVVAIKNCYYYSLSCGRYLIDKRMRH